MKRGFTLVECLLASSLLCLLVLAVFESIIVSTRIGHENSDLLAAEAIAWDAAWKRFNEPFESLAVNTTTSEDLTKAAAPHFWDWNNSRWKYGRAPKLTITVTASDLALAGASTSVSEMLKITTDVEWGTAANPRTLSSVTEGAALSHAPVLYRGRMGRAQ